MNDEKTLPVTEMRNPRSMDLDLLSSEQMLQVINAEDRTVADAVAAQIPQIAKAVEAAAGALRGGGRLIYVGAGSSGRIGLLDALECPPGHAGLFSTAEEVGRFGQVMLDGGAAPHGAVLAQTTVAEATRDHTGGLEDARGLGWRCRRGSAFMGVRVSPAAFGHTGFTGTSLLVDPRGALVVVLLTNRVHPRATTTAIESFRAQFHDAVIEAMER